jgi:hypothetical protein
MFKIILNGSLGEITINDFKEHFKIGKGYWTTARYRVIWNAELNRLLSAKRSTCCLTTWMSSPKLGGSFRGWLLYRRYNRIVITERLWVKGLTKPRFRTDETIIIKNEIPRRASKWRIHISDIAN